MSPNPDCAELRSLLEIEQACCTGLRAVLDAERAAVRGYELPALLETLKEREALQGQWQRAAAARRRRVSELVDGLRTAFAADPTLESVVVALREDVAEVRRQQEINEGLLVAAIGSVTELLSVLRRGLPGVRYDERAALTSPLPVVRSSHWRA
jgi:flagellar biosynthesis/type III secretory pathway chaperone